jgi:ribosomal-protein-alanine N-acetyltransferase
MSHRKIDPKNPPIEIRHMRRSDLPQVLAIESLCFRHPWDAEDFRFYSKNRSTIGIVAEYSDASGTHVIGYAIYDLMRGSIHILNLAVTPAFQHRNVGRRFIAKLAGKLAINRRRKIVAIVHERNTDALIFLTRLGFVSNGITNGFYRECDDAAIGMEYRIEQLLEATEQEKRRQSQQSQPQQKPGSLLARQ